MSRHVIIIDGKADRERAMQWVARSPFGMRIEFKEQKRRSIDQNSLMWSLLSQVATQHVHYGMKYSKDDWKLIFLNGLNLELRIAPNLNGNGLVNLGVSSSDLSMDEMTQLIELIFAFGAQNGVIFREHKEHPSPSISPADEREKVPA